MGYFQAFCNKSGKPVEFTGNSIKELDKIDSQATPTVDIYYESILKAAIPNFQTEQPKGLIKGIDCTIRDNLSNFWLTSEIEMPFQHIFGFIENDTNDSDNELILGKIANEENNYYWKWYGDGEKVEYEREEILTKLQIADVRILKNVFATEKGKANSNIINKERNGQENSTSFLIPAIAITTSAIYQSTDKKNFFGVFVNEQAKLLFLDTDEDDKWYKYGKIGDNYARCNTFIYYSQNIEPNRNIFNGENNDHFIGKDNTRYCAKLTQILNKKSSSSSQGNIFPDYNLAKDGNEEGIKAKFEEKHIPEEIKKKAITKPAQAEAQAIEKKLKAEVQSIIQSAQAEAHDRAHCLPNGSHCFYFDSNTVLSGFISMISIGEGQRAGVGYSMRADKVNEVDYRWTISLKPTDENYHIAKLWSYIFELDPNKQEVPKIKKDKSDTTEGAFYPTNWPYAKTNGFKTATESGESAKSMESWIKYYKKFTEKEKKRNKPPGNVFPPRVTNPNPEIGIYDYKFQLRKLSSSVKLDNVSYRVWKKVDNDDKDITLKDTTLPKNKKDRLDAGMVMANALNKFEIYEEMKKSGVTPKITDSKLSATAFARYMLKGDSDDKGVKKTEGDEFAKKQWHEDNKMAVDVTSDSLQTDQEWCHLFGHGDGGSEELGNFVSGSKHCNTEQLAIETGQRRVSHSEDSKVFSDAEKKKITARITAYLMPNKGTWVSGASYTPQQLEELNIKITDSDVQNYINIFFEKFNDKKGKEMYRLKTKEGDSKSIDSATLISEFKKLSEEISALPAIDKNKKIKLLKFRHNLEINFFMYLPLARWMRYKLYYGGIKIFDHIYDAQSESMNLHECQILDYTVERILYNAMGKWDEYKKLIKERAKPFVPTDEEAKIIKNLIDQINLLTVDDGKNLITKEYTEKLIITIKNKLAVINDSKNKSQLFPRINELFQIFFKYEQVESLEDDDQTMSSEDEQVNSSEEDQAVPMVVDQPEPKPIRVDPIPQQTTNHKSRIRKRNDADDSGQKSKKEKIVDYKAIFKDLHKYAERYDTYNKVKTESERK